MESDAFEQELFIGGICFGSVAGWSLHAAWRNDWSGLGIGLALMAAYLIYRHIRIGCSINVGFRD